MLDLVRDVGGLVVLTIQAADIRLKLRLVALRRRAIGAAVALFQVAVGLGLIWLLLLLAYAFQGEALPATPDDELLRMDAGPQILCPHDDYDDDGRLPLCVRSARAATIR